MRYLTPDQVYKQFGYHPKTTADWADSGKIECIRSPGGHRRYPESAFISPPKSDKERVLYARVSTRTQLEELNNQIDYLGKTYPGCRVVKDIASGMNWKRKNFIKLMTQVSNNEIFEIVVGHKDRLCRFGFEFVEWFCNLHNCKIVVINNAKLSPHEELMQDFMSIMHCFSSKLYFLRAYKKKIEEEQNISDIQEPTRSQCESM
jgi:predicted site-specific integrase-resolvase